MQTVFSVLRCLKPDLLMLMKFYVVCRVDNNMVKCPPPWVSEDDPLMLIKSNVEKCWVQCPPPGVSEAWSVPNQLDRESLSILLLLHHHHHTEHSNHILHLIYTFTFSNLSICWAYGWQCHLPSEALRVNENMAHLLSYETRTLQHFAISFQYKYMHPQIYKPTNM